MITCAVTGSFDTVSKNPAVPVSPIEIAQSALDAAAAGAAIVHIHVRDPDTGDPSMDIGLYREEVKRIHDQRTDTIINLTTGPGGRFVPGLQDASPQAGTTLLPPAERIAHVQELNPDICSLDVATMNFGEAAFLNVPAHLRFMAEHIREAGVVPELEVFEPGHIRLARKLMDEELVDEPGLFQICLGIDWSQPATPEAMLYMRSLLPKQNNRNFFAKFPMIMLLSFIVFTLLYFLAMTISYMVQQQQHHVALLRNRGISTFQILRLYALEGSIISIISMLIGPLLAYAIIAVLGVTPMFYDLTGAKLLPISINWLPFALSSGIGLIHLGLFVIFMILGSQPSLVSLGMKLSRPSKYPFYQRYYLSLIHI